MPGEPDERWRIAPEVHFSGREVLCYANRPGSVDALLREAAAHNPRGDAIVSPDTRLSYAALDALVDTIAANLGAAGLRPGDRVALLMGNRAEFVTVLMATMRTGAIAVPINVREQTPGLAYILNHSGAAALVYDGAAADRLPPPADTPDLRLRYAVAGAAGPARPFDELVREGALSPKTHASDEEDVVAILYTSGTTGRPKGVMLTHFNVCHSVMHFEHCMALGQDDRSVLAVPASHITGLVANLLTMIRVAGCNIILPAFTVEGFLELASAERMTYSIMVPAMYNLCLLRADLKAYALGDWRIGGYGGAPMPEPTIAELERVLPDLVLMNAYGATETTSPATLMPMGDTADHPDSVGKTVPCGHIRIVDAEGRDVAAGNHGEIWISGPMVTPGYWCDPDITTASIVDGYWKSGDIGAMDADGYLRLYDRAKDMIVRGGYNVYSAEVENVLTDHPGVIECAVVAHPDPILGEKVHVFVQAEPGGATAEDVRSFCAERLADYKIPDFVTFIDDPLPRNANGKVLKNVLRERVAQGTSD